MNTNVYLRFKQWILRNHFAALILLVLICLFFIALNGLFSYPMGDDYSYALMGRRSNLFEISLSEYKTWNGRFISNLFVVLNPIRWHSIILYRAIPVLLIVILWWSLFVVFKLFVFDRRTRILFSGILLILYLQGVPIISEGLYWYTGSVTYLLGLIFFNLFVVANLSNQRSYSIWNFFFYLFFMILSAGSNEVLALWIVLTTGYFSIKKQSIRLEFLFALFLFGVVFFAPGNEVRMAHFENTRNLFYSIKMTILQLGRFTIFWFFTLSNLSVVLIVVFFKKKIQLIISNSIDRIGIYEIIILYTIFLSASIFPAYYSTGIMGQHRTVNLSYELFLLTELILILKIKIPFSISRRIAYSFAATGILSLFISGNIGDVISDLASGKSYRFAEQNKERMELFNRKVIPACVPKIDNLPITLLNYELTQDTSDWKNTCFKDFYGLSKSPVGCE